MSVRQPKWVAVAKQDSGGDVAPWVRLAAATALAAAVGALGIGAFALIDDYANVLFALLCVSVVAFFGWLVLTRDGLVRLLAVPVAVLGLVGLIGVAAAHVVSLVVLVVMLLLFGAAARYAVTRSPTPVAVARVGGRSARPARPPRRGVLIINPRSGAGKAHRFDLVTEARKRGVEPVLLESGDDLSQLAERAVSSGADVIGMAGGDGSQALLAEVAMRHDVAHVCVPAGTRNHFALDLGLDREDVVGALDAFTDGVERRIDLARVNDRVFVNNVSLGVYAQVVQSDSYRNAKLRTWRRMLPEMLGPDAIPVHLQFEGPDGKTWSDAALVLVSNNPYQVMRPGGAGTRPRLDTGQLGILVVRLRGARAFAKLATLSAVGHSSRSGELREWSSAEFDVRSDRSIAVGLDGEAVVLASPLRFASLPAALRLRVPRNATGQSPAGAAVALSRVNVGALLRIAAGKGVQRPPV